ncbi:MAG: glycosyltransferase family 4 protein [Patescibacteria group bacterium]
MNENKEPVRKIFYVITKSNWGGAQKYVYDLATGLSMEKRQKQYESLVVFGGTGPLSLKLAEAGIKTISIPNLARDINIFADISSFFRLLSLFKKEKPDIVHINSSKIGGLGGLAARIAGVPRIIFTCHGWPWNEDRNFFSLSIIKFLSWLTVVLAHETIAVSGKDFSDGKHMFWVKNKIVLVHNGIKSPDFRERAESRAYIAALAKNTGVDIGENDFLVGAVGELHRNKAYEYALRAVAILKQKNIPVKLAILGEGEERRFLESLAAKLGIEKDVALAGFVGDAPQYLRAFDALVLSSLKEGLPYVVIEAGSAGLPVVATNVGGVREIIDDMKSGILVQTRKPDEIASALEFMHKNPEKARIFGQNLRQKAEHEFSLGKMIEETIAVYESRTK